jgi:hypothetical protein
MKEISDETARKYLNYIFDTYRIDDGENSKKIYEAVMYNIENHLSLNPMPNNLNEINPKCVRSTNKYGATIWIYLRDDDGDEITTAYALIDFLANKIKRSEFEKPTNFDFFVLQDRVKQLEKTVNILWLLK